MGRIIPYIMENKKMFETTDQNIVYAALMAKARCNASLACAQERLATEDFLGTGTTKEYGQFQ